MVADLSPDEPGFLDGLLAGSSDTTRWHIVCDNLDIHMSKGVVVVPSSL